MSFRGRIAAVSAGVLAAVTAVGPVAAEPPGWTPPARVRGTTGQANPLSATAPDGSDLVLWGVGGATSPQNIVRARLRPAGRDRWLKIDSPMRNKDYGGVLGIAPTPDGDFWVLLSWEDGSGRFESYVRRLDTSTRRWSKTQRVFHQKGYDHFSGSLGVSDNGVVYVASTARPDTPTSPPTYRSAVAVKYPGRGWQQKFLSPKDDFGSTMNVAVSRKGRAVVAFIQGYNLPDMTVRAATRGSGRKSRWQVRTLSVAGDAQRAYAAIGPDGTAAVEWSAPSTGSATVRLAVRAPGRLEPWVSGDAVSGGTNIASFPVVAPDGSATALWEQYSNPNSLLTARQFTHGTWGSPHAFSQAGLRGVLDSARLRADGTVGVLYQQFSAGPANEGLRLQVLDHAVPGGALTLTDAGDGSANSAALGVDAALHHLVVWTRGDYPDTDFAWMGDAPSGPTVVKNTHSGVEVTTAAVKGVTRVGRTVTCRSGFWVEASSVVHRWFRGSAAIPGATGRSYRLVGADRGHKVSCRATGRSDSGSTSVRSPKRVVH